VRNQRTYCSLHIQTEAAIFGGKQMKTQALVFGGLLSRFKGQADEDTGSFFLWIIEHVLEASK
jgi:hypothetical protein